MRRHKFTQSEKKKMIIDFCSQREVLTFDLHYSLFSAYFKRPSTYFLHKTK